MKPVDELIQNLLGNQNKIDKNISTESYQLPIKINRAGLSLDDKNKPSIIGTFIPKGYINPKHTHGHPAVDYAAPKGTSVYPIASGKVIETQVYPKGGKTCKVAHENGAVVSYYAHMDQVNVQVGSEVNQTSVLGTVGNTGSAFDTSPHIHLEVKVNGSHKDPQIIIGKPVGSLSAKKIAGEFEDILNKYSQSKPKPASQAISKIIDQFLFTTANKIPLTGQEIVQILGPISGSQIGEIVKALKSKQTEQPLTKEASISFIKKFKL